MSNRYAEKISADEQPLIDWVNSLDVPSCALVDSVQDLRSGTTMADIVAMLLGKPSLPGIERNAYTLEEAISNWDIILEELAPFLDEDLASISADSVLEHDSLILEFIAFLASLEDPENTLPYPDLPRQQTSYQTSASRLEGPQELPSMYEPQEITPQETIHLYNMQDPQDSKDFSEETQSIYKDNFHKKQPQPSEDAPLAPPKQTDFEAPPVHEGLKEGIIDWIEELQIVRKKGLDSQILPSICLTGVLFCDIVNRLEGRSAPIKGVERNPKNKAQASANINKALEHLRKYPKMQGRYLWSTKQILAGSENVIWGLLQDIRQHYSITTAKPRLASKSPARPLEIAPKPEVTSHPPIVAPKPAVASRPPVAPKPAVIHEKPKAEMLPKQESKTPDLSLPYEFLQEKSKNLRGYARSHRSRTPIDKSPSVCSRRSRMDESMIEQCSEDTKHTVKEWLWALDIEFIAGNSSLNDPLRNGELFCELIRVVEGVRVQVNPNPKSVRAVRDNFERGMEVLKKKKAGVPSKYFYYVDALAEEIDFVWSLLYAMYLAYPSAVPLYYQPSQLNYGAVQIKKLEEDIIDWFINIEIVNPEMRPTFFDIISEMKSGMLLCEITARLFKTRLPKVVVNPTTEQSALNNIRKALEVLRKVPKLPQKFTWKEREVQKGNPSIILGLLEDIYNYWSKKNQSSSFIEEPSEPLNATFGSNETARTVMSNEALLQWLDNLGIAVPRTLLLENEFLPEFSTGVLLCDIVSKIEKITIPGVDRDPRSKNVAIKNIRKALEVLSRKPTFPRKLLQTEDFILEGESEVIGNILRELVKLGKARNL